MGYRHDHDFRTERGKARGDTAKTGVTFEGSRASRARGSIFHAREQFKETLLQQVRTNHIPGDDMNGEERLAFIYKLRDAICDGATPLTRYMPCYYKLDLSTFGGDHDTAKQTLAALFTEQNIPFTFNGGERLHDVMLFEVDKDEDVRLQRFLRTLETKREALREFGR